MRADARDLFWRLLPPAPAGPATWDPDPGDLAVRWPARYEWEEARRWVDDVANGLARRVPLERVDLPQTLEGVVSFEVEAGGARHEVAIDYFDKSRLLDEVADRFALVFKLQHARDGYGRANVVPGGYVPSRAALYRFLRPARRRRGRAPSSDLYGRFSLNHAPEVRRHAVELLRAQDRFGYEGDLKLTGYAAFLTDAAGARACLDLPGNGDLCHRLVEYLALGCCVVRPEPQTRLPVDLVHDREIVFCRRDLSDLVDVCAELVADEPRRRRIGAAARAYFDRHLHRHQLSGYYLDRLVRAFGVQERAA